MTFLLLPLNRPLNLAVNSSRDISGFHYYLQIRSRSISALQRPKEDIIYPFRSEQIYTRSLLPA